MDDTMIEATRIIIAAFATLGYEIHFVTGRTEAGRPETETWLERIGFIYDGLWMDDTPDGDHFAVYGGHSQYKVARVKDVEKATGKKVILHIDDWAEVKVALENEGIPTMCVRTPFEVRQLTSGEAESTLA